jgi:hypothetical protein
VRSYIEREMLEDPTMTAWFTMMGELIKPPYPGLHRVELSLNDLAVNLPDFRKNPDVGLIAGTTSAVKIPSSSTNLCSCRARSDCVQSFGSSDGASFLHAKGRRRLAC